MKCALKLLILLTTNRIDRDRRCVLQTCILANLNVRKRDKAEWPGACWCLCLCPSPSSNWGFDVFNNDLKRLLKISCPPFGTKNQLPTIWSPWRTCPNLLSWKSHQVPAWRQRKPGSGEKKVCCWFFVITDTKLNYLPWFWWLQLEGQGTLSDLSKHQTWNPR